MEAAKEDLKQGIESLFLSQAQESGVKLRIGQMNKTEHEGVIRDIGRYEINIEENGKIITLLKQELSFLSVSKPLLNAAPQNEAQPDLSSPAAASAVRPNIQQEFLDKAIREGHLLTFYLMNGQRLKAHVQAYDNFTLLLKEGERQHLFYKHSITTINR